MDTDPGKWSRLYLGVVGPVAFVRGVIVAAELGRYLLRRPVTSCCHEGDKTENVSNRHSRQLANREKGGGTRTSFGTAGSCDRCSPHRPCCPEARDGLHEAKVEQGNISVIK
jgi:hypothetical protein